MWSGSGRYRKTTSAVYTVVGGENMNLLIHITAVVFGCITGECDDMVCLR